VNQVVKLNRLDFGWGYKKSWRLKSNQTKGQALLVPDQMEIVKKPASGYNVDTFHNVIMPGNF